MGAVSDGVWEPVRPGRQAPAATGHGFLAFLQCAIALTAIVAVVGAVLMGQTTVALIIGIVSGAFFAGRIC